MSKISNNNSNNISNKELDENKSIKNKLSNSKAGQFAINKGKNLKDNVKQNAYNKIGINPEEIMKAKGTSGKALAVAKQLGGKAAEKYEWVGKAVDFGKNVANAVRFIITYWKPILITILVIVAAFCITVRFLNFYQAVGNSPHYYCDIEADDGIKKTQLYKQYCATGNSLDLENLQGHYITQYKSGPCTDCAFLNMYLRYFTKNGINFYEYLWNDEGECPNKFTDTSIGEVTAYEFFSDNGSAEDSDKYISDTATGGPAAFAMAHGKSLTANHWNANWGYIYSEDEYTDYENFNGSDLWVWDLSHGLCRPGPNASWGAGWQEGKTMTIDGVTATLRGGTTISESDLIKLVQEHPSGVEVYGAYGSDGHHAFLLTKYENGEFWCVDSAMYMAGGFEGPFNDPNYARDCSREAIHNITNYYYIEEDTE